MCRLLLNLVYLAVIAAALPVLLYRRFVLGKYRQGWHEKLTGQVPERLGEAPCLWLHAVSVGEVLQLQPVLEGWKAAHPDWDIYISTTTPTGRQVAEKQYPGCVICYCPLDFTWAVRTAFRRIRPTCLALVELELWPNLILEARQQQVQCLLINGRLSEKSFRGYSRLKLLLRPLWQTFSLIAVQNQEYADRFVKLGVDSKQLLLAGSIKFDRLQTNRQARPVLELRNAFAIPAGKPVLMAGSTHPPEEEIVLRVWQKLKETTPDLQLIIAPRHAERFDEVAQLIEKQGLKPIRRSGTKATVNPESIPISHATSNVYLLDTLGELSHCWGLADYAYVGGSLNQRGGQNMMEPSAYGAAVLFGPNTWNFAEVVTALKQHRACVEVADEMELFKALKKLISEPQGAQIQGENSRKYVLSQQGGTSKTLEVMEQLLICPVLTTNGTVKSLPAA